MLKQEAGVCNQPIGFQLMGESSEPALVVRECVPVKHRARQVLTAVRTLNDRLELLSWRVNADGSVIRTGSSGPQRQRVLQIDMARGRKYVVACRTGARRLQLVSWDVSNTGAIYRAGDSGRQGEQILQVKLLALSDTLFVTACIGADRCLKLTTWQLNEDDSLTPLFESEACGEPVRSVTAVHQQMRHEHHCVTTVVRTQTNRFQLITWHIASDGKVVRWAASSDASEAVSQVSTTVLEDQRVATAFHTASGHFRLATWNRIDEGCGLHRQLESRPPALHARHHALMAWPGGAVAALCTPAGELEMHTWTMPTHGPLAQIGKSALSIRNAVEVAFCNELLDGNAPILTCIRLTNGTLKLVTWRM